MMDKGHTFKMDKVKILAREDQFHARKIREALHIHTSKPTLNRDHGLEIPLSMLRLLPHDCPGKQK